MRVRTALPALLLLLPGVLSAQRSETWNWAGTIPAGQAIEIKGVNGRIEASLASGSEVKVTARKTGNDDDPAEVKLEVVEHADGVTICAVYPAPRGRPANDCQPGTRGRSNVSNNDVRVAFTVEVPRGTRLVARTVNGDIRALGLAGDVHARTVNGDVNLSTSGVGSAETVNGSIEANIGRADWRDELAFETVNGTIALGIAGELNAVVTANTVNGSIETDFPLTVRGRFGPKRLTGTVGTGGRELALSTVNGSIELRRR